MIPQSLEGNVPNLRSISAKPIPERMRMSMPDFRPGPAPMLQWIDVHLLVVDDSYQRAMGSLAWRHILAIAKEFNWSKFMPVMIAPIEGGLYAIIDGQHRTTAAFLRNIKSVPCCVVQADRAQQADAFAAINSKTTRLYQNNIFHAEVEAGNELALRIVSVCERAGVKIPRNKMSRRDMPVNGTVAIAALRAVVSTYGEEVSITALQCIVETGEGNKGMLKGVLIRSLAEVLAKRPLWRESCSALFEAFDNVDFEEQIDLAEQDAKVGIATPLSALVKRLGDILDGRQLHSSPMNAAA